MEGIVCLIFMFLTPHNMERFLLLIIVNIINIFGGRTIKWMMVPPLPHYNTITEGTNFFVYNLLLIVIPVITWLWFGFLMLR